MTDMDTDAAQANQGGDAVSVGEAEVAGTPGRIRAWIVNHDRSLVFAASYVSLTIVLSVFISYFWLVALVGVHFVLEWLKKGYIGYRDGGHRLAWSLWDIKFDIALIFLALTLLSYTGINAGVAGAQSASRVGLLGGRLGAVGARLGPVASRLARVSQVLQRIGIKVVDVFFSARVALFRKADMARSAKEERYLDPDAGVELGVIPQELPWRQRLTGGAWFALIVISVNILAIAIAPLLTGHTYGSLFESLAGKLHPWPI